MRLPPDNLPADQPTRGRQSSTPGRLAGEPAFCSGRHCCHWQVNGWACNNHYPSATDLDQHIISDHAGRHPNGQPSSEHLCHWAGCSKTETFGNKPKLIRHIHSHTGHKPYQCSHANCDRGFVTKEQLKNHETTHTKSKQHVCPDCGKGFAVKTALTSHMNVHKGAKPYLCDECGKGFADSSNLSKHKAIHKRQKLKLLHTARTTHTHGHLHQKHSIAQPSHLAIQPSHALDSWALDQLATSTGGLLTSHDYCYRPCFEYQCPSQDRVPCRSVSPCRSMPCISPDCPIEPCDSPACAQEPCDLQDCCDLPECEAEQCFLRDCTHLCDDDCCADDGVLMTPSTTTTSLGEAPDQLGIYYLAESLRIAQAKVAAPGVQIVQGDMNGNYLGLTLLERSAQTDEQSATG